LPAFAGNDKPCHHPYAPATFEEAALKFYSFWRSLASFRVRIALNIKGIVPDEVVEIDLLKGVQREAAYKKVNPQMLLPALVDGEGPILFQSIAIMEYLDETHPQPPLLPKDPRGRARVRALALINAADSHPLMVPRVRNFMEHELKLDEAAREKWIKHWIAEGLAAMEGHLSRDKETGKFAHGDAVTMADICVAAQVTGAGFFKVDVGPYPTVMRIATSCMELAPFAKAHPLKQPGAPAALSH
jgi:maleylacetoacetate isomerase/maleylpyruvate isomerase